MYLIIKVSLIYRGHLTSKLIVQAAKEIILQLSIKLWKLTIWLPEQLPTQNITFDHYTEYVDIGGLSLAISVNVLATVSTYMLFSIF